ncbi:MAG: cation:proton antiporter [Methanoregulaceae archaeon]|nr:cation:proton antiporter [Methanoregulaceae archaeon]
MEGIVLALLVCLILALLTKHLSAPVTPFYILAGIVVGTSGLKIVAADDISHFSTELGLIFLLFFLGLELKPGRILSNRKTFLASGLLDLNINFLIGFGAAFLLGFPLIESLVIASAFFISSTAMTVASLIENRKLMMREAETIVWMMVFEDIVLIVVLTLLSSSLAAPALFVGEIAAFFAVFFLISTLGRGYILKIMNRDDELPVIFTFSSVIAVAFLAQQAGLPESLMVIAFGAALATTDPVKFEIQAQPFKDVFLVVFFVFFGIGVDFSGGIPLLIIAALSLLAIVSKFLSGIAIGHFVHGKSGAGIEIWANTIGRGEFSIALATLYGSVMVSTIIAGLVITTSIVGSFSAKYSDRISQLFRKWGLFQKSPS